MLDLSILQLWEFPTFLFFFYQFDFIEIIVRMERYTIVFFCRNNIIIVYMVNTFISCYFIIIY